MKWRDSVRAFFATYRFATETNPSIVFRAAHESSKAMRTWMGEMKKKS